VKLRLPLGGPGRLPDDTPRPEVEACLAAGTLLLEQAGVDTARLDAECLLAAVLDCPRWQLVLEPRRHLPVEAFSRYLALLARRERREPVAYLLGRREFWSLSLAVSPDVLIPRPETETLVEAALALLRDGRPDASVVELCTGSGAIAIALARELPAARILATDVSARALALAAGNARAHGVADQVRFLRGDLWRALNGDLAGRGADLVVANPPYVRRPDLVALTPEVQWEPRLALDGGPDGLDCVREIVQGAPARLAPGAHLALEIGADQGAPVRGLLAAQPALEDVRLLQDLAGRDRVALAQRRKE
jgi:release factor glutamine methyltransferase